MRPPVFSLIGPRGLYSCCWPFLPRSRRGGAGGPKFADRSRDGPEAPPGRGPKPPPPNPPAATAEAAAKATARARPGRPAWPSDRGSRRGHRRVDGRPILARPRFADRQIASLEWLRVEFPDDLFGDRTVGELDEGKPSRSAGLAIDRHDHVGRFCDRREVSPEIRFRRAVRQVADEEPDSQGFPERPRDCIPGV